MKKQLTILGISIMLFSCGPKSVIKDDSAVNNPIVTEIDLINVKEDRVPVVINPGRFTTESITYRLPKVVQGTYSVSDFGKYVDDFKAIDYDGNELVVNKIDTNTWTINNATKLDKIEYLVNDTFDIETRGGIGGDQPFSPSGTNIAPDNYVLNLHGFIGYFDTLKTNQYSLDVISPTDFKRTSAIQTTGSRVNEDGSTTTSYFAPRYFDITDNPMMYGNLDVEEFQVGDIKIVLSVYSPNKVHTAASIKETVFKMMQGQKAYLGDLNSTPRYDIYLYLADTQKQDSPKGFGALEHHTSTIVVLPEQSTPERLANSMVDVVAHEFFHIVTPLSVHSEDVHYFDYNAPTFSKHLWMYEGLTEYFAQHFQIKESLVEADEFYATILGKINFSKQAYDDTMSFTKMSENILEEPYATNYANVYQKGALIGMCIDILMREESNGERSMLSLMKELSLKYGKDKPFEDDNIITEITAMTYPSISEFLKTYVEGNTPIDYNVFFEKVGLSIEEGRIKTNFILQGGRPIVSGSPDKGIFFVEQVNDNSFWNEQGVKPNDVIKQINGTDVTLQNANTVLQEVFGWQVGQEIEVKLDRNGEEIIIKTITTQPYTKGEELKEKNDATSQQVTLRNAWLKG
ncbi:peptidase M61 [Flavobacteriaceae bacterium AU392]|nr:peptidase M61 [Flavobacteriaceae bacterium]RKM85498.1 peptidase M61 [Flavobacteriaceae bacterium AU392]